jgi:hypothetical protein
MCFRRWRFILRVRLRLYRFVQMSNANLKRELQLPQNDPPKKSIPKMTALT